VAQSSRIDPTLREHIIGDNDVLRTLAGDCAYEQYERATDAIERFIDAIRAVVNNSAARSTWADHPAVTRVDDRRDRVIAVTVLETLAALGVIDARE
jgi:hypothetical protein